jgi:hypothetical protein
VFLDDPSILFNVSHQGDLAVLAGVTGCLPGHSLGVDVMKFEYSGGKTLSEFFRIMTRNFSQLVNFHPALGIFVLNFKIFCLCRNGVRLKKVQMKTTS